MARAKWLAGIRMRRNITCDDGAPLEAKTLAQITATLDANTHRFAGSEAA